MMYEYSSAKSIVVSGDIHGNFTDLVFKVCMSHQMTDTLVIVAGDCGFGFSKPGYFENLYKKCLRRLEKFNNWIVFIRGNHDNPAYFDGQVVNHERWRAVPDYSIIKACGHTILCVGGATSVDWEWRKASEYHHFDNSIDPLQQDLYWPDEVPAYDEVMLKAVNEVCAVDTVVTHTSPTFCELATYRHLENWAVDDPALLKDVKAEREVMDRILAFLKENGHPLRQWYYGHYHQSWHSEIDGVQYNMLDCMELREVR